VTTRAQRLVFGEVARSYDDVRAGYPAEVGERVFTYAGGRYPVVEVGAGTGKGPKGGGGSGAGAGLPDAPEDEGFQGLDPDRPTLRPKLYWFNALLTVVLLTAMIMEWLPIPVLFLLGAALALTVNFPHMPDQKARLGAHAENVLNVSGMVFAAAVFTGVLQGTGMVDHMAKWMVDVIPEGMGPHMALVTGVLSLPLTYFMSNDGFYFGVLPVLAEAGAAHGVTPLEMARASLVGQPLHQSSPIVASFLLLVGLAKVDLGDHHRKTIWRAVVVGLIMLAVGGLTLAFPL